MVKETPTGYPTWVDKFYFSDLLRKDYSQFKIVRFNVEPLNAKGENYASLMYRVKLTFENSETGLAHRNFVVKTNLLMDGVDAKLMEAFNVFPKEIQMYNEVIPEFEALYKNIGESVQIGPKYVFSSMNLRERLYNSYYPFQVFCWHSRSRRLDHNGGSGQQWLPMCKSIYRFRLGSHSGGDC